MICGKVARLLMLMWEHGRKKSIILFSTVVKITDMGLSKLVGVDTVCKTFCGTPQYLAPEVLISHVRVGGTYDFKVFKLTSVWSFCTPITTTSSGRFFDF
jgi:serine/threonine protein kinase